MVGLWVGAIALIVAWAALPAASLESGNWGGLPPWQRLLAEAVAALGGFVAGAAIASRVAWLRRLFTPRRQMRDEVAARARTVFFDRRVHHTAGASGLLVYVSLYERMAILLADQSILDKVGQGSLDAWCAALTAALREGHPADAIAKAIALAGEKLGQVLPRATADVNELPDALVLLDG
jgi:putative membrane protein